MDMMRDDSQMYMSHEMMALFNDGGVDVQHLFSSDFMQQPQPQAQHGQTQQQHHHQNDSRNGTDGSTPVSSYVSPGFLKMNGLATSP